MKCDYEYRSLYLTHLMRISVITNFLIYGRHFESSVTRDLDNVLLYQVSSKISIRKVLKYYIKKTAYN